MLVPLQTSGSKPPLFFVHGLRGIAFAVGSRFACMLGSDQPLYVVNANGMDGRRPVIEHVREMVIAYLQEIGEARPQGAVRIGAMCAGCFIAIEIARALEQEQRLTGSVILVDPPVIPAGYELRQDTTDVKPELADRMYQEVRSRFIERLQDPDGYDDLPFDPQDPNQLHAAVVVATRTMVAFARYVPRPFSGAAEVIISQDRAAAFLHPRMPWSKVLFGSRLVHVVPWSHREMFRSGRKTVARLMKSALEEEPKSETVAERRIVPALTTV
jgi:thioesterase domain-containing protein